MLSYAKRIYLKKHFTYLAILLVLLLVAGGCSTKKNTWLSRNYQALNTDFNVYFNGYNSYNDGLKNIIKANKEDYSAVIPMYPISHHSNAKAATSDMDRTIEKCRKAIKLHSIKVKPKKNYSKVNDPDYKLYYNQEEFNPSMKHAWILLGKAEFHKGEFLGSVGTFSYIMRHFSWDKNLTITCQLWVARAYGEMDWIYEAEQTLTTVAQDNLKGDNVGLFASVNADLLLKKKQFKEAIPFLEMALSKEKDKYQRQRFTYVLAQLYQKTGDDKASYKAYQSVLKMNPSYEMDFNARISQAQLGAANVVKVRKELNKMLRNKNNKEYLDQVYYALGQTYLKQGDTLTALQNFRLSADTSSRKGIDKAQTLVTMGDLYYKRRNYVSAQPCYDEASKILTNENDDFVRVSKRAETLGELVQHYEVVQLQDSLQRLSKMSEIERMKVIEKVIARLIAGEKAAERKALADNQRRTMNPDDDMMNSGPIGSSSGSWYFYNPDIMRSGQTEFIKKWGRRKLEDNWRRTSKSSTLFGDDTAQATANAAGTDTTATKTEEKSNVKQETDNKKPEFYIQQIPVKPSQVAKSNEMLATALFAMAEVYKDKVEDYPMAQSTFEDFIKRFPVHKQVVDAYYNLYMIQIRQGNSTQAEAYRQKIVRDFPESKYAKVLSDPNYGTSLQRMNGEQDSLYEATYKAYNASEFQKVFDNTAYFRKNFSLSPLMPKFLLLNALSLGKKDTPANFRKALEELVSNYPGSDVSAMAKDMLALVGQGQVSRQGTTGGSLLAKRDEILPQTSDVDITKLKFSNDKQGRHRLMLVSSSSLEVMQRLQYAMASYNFSRFVIKDFDLVINKLDTARSALSITNFESYEEVTWYLKNLREEPSLTKMLYDMNAREVIISEENFGLLRTNYKLEDYLAFETSPKSANPAVPTQIATAKSVKSTEKQGKTANTAVAKSTVKAQIDTKTETTGGTVPAVTTSADLLANNAESEKKPEPAKQRTETKETKETKVEKVAESKPAKVDESRKPEAAKPEGKMPAAATAVVQPRKKEEPPVPLFKGLFGFRANEPHYVAFYVLSGTVDFEKLKAAFDAYNKTNYPKQTLTLSIEKLDKVQVVILGSFSDAASSKEYLFRIVKEKSLFDGLKGANYRNLLGSQKNLNVVVQQNALNTYFEFMQQYYLK